MAVSFYAIYCINKQKISNSTLFWQMLFDVLALAGQIYFSGGISNPFISLFLLQVVVASILLKTSYAWLIGIITCFFYALLSHYYYRQPAVLQHHHTFDFHLQGMMLVHFLSSFLLIFFISKIMQNIAFEQQKNQELNQKILSKQKLAEMGLLATNTISHIYIAYNIDFHLQGMMLVHFLSSFLLIFFISKIMQNIAFEQQKNQELNQKILSKQKLAEMGLLATNYAHNLGTPLTNIDVIINDWQKLSLATVNQKEFALDLENIKQQIGKCKKILSDILQHFQHQRLENYNKISFADYCKSIVLEWQQQKQCQQLNYQFNCQQNHQIIFDNLLKQAIFNVFDNAFECSGDTVFIDIADNKNSIIITTTNAGHFNAKALQNLGKKNISTKNSSGLGLFLTMQILESFHGNLIINNLNNFVEVKIIIPLLLKD